MREEIPFPDRVLQTLHNLCGTAADLAWKGDELAKFMQIDPNEVESVVMNHPGVAECAVIGVPDERSGEAVKLVVVKKDPSLREDELVAYCKTQLTGYKRPHFIDFRDSLPKTPIGKILRRELRDEKR